ncbi:Phasin [Anianabacter salinae]|uniref:Phasin n=1 Tax=Anianabacter salinae TaxID=2851023 RepID=UPI00225E3EE8|nr:Phasin [Anianabacter salinae]MBV0912577.1 Phasin [Anianabacter salinae]
MATKTATTDYTKMMKDMMGAFPVDMTAMQDTFKSQADLSDKMSKVAFEAADKSTEISTKWTKETLAKLADVTTAKDDVADYTKAMTDFASSQAEMTSEAMSAFAEVAKKVQMETVELMLSAGKTMQEDASVAMKKASDDMTAATKKATAAAK